MTKEKELKGVLTPSQQNLFSSKEYASTLADIKKDIEERQLHAMLAVNKELICLYWNIGKRIVEKQEKSGWGSNVINQLAKDLQTAFPGIDGFSRSNVFRMRAFYRSYQKVAQAVRQIENLPIFQIPWGHNILISERIKNNEERLWYAEQTIKNGWSRSALEDCIEADLYSRQGKAVSNFSSRLSECQSKMAQDAFRDPYNFDFLRLRVGFHEKELEEGLIEQIQKTLIEFGHGFAFVRRQYPLEVDGDVYYIDLLFYHIPTHRYVAVELKTEHFKPEHTGQMNFYLSALDDKLKIDIDNPSIGLILCKKKSKFKAEYALRDIHKPIAVAGYGVEILKTLPKELMKSFPSVKEIETELERV